MKKLFVITRDDLTPAQQAVQAGHAVAKYVFEFRDEQWVNGTLVYLVVDRAQLDVLIRKLELHGYAITKFREPDLEDQITSIAVIGADRFLSKFKLMGA